MKKPLLDAIKERPLLGDGAMGTQLMIAGLEQPLFENGNVTFDRGAPGALIEFVLSGSTFKPGRQWRYMISPTPQVDQFDDICNDGENGLVELLALSETTLISMERSCLMTRDKLFTANTVQLFSVELIAGDARLAVNEFLVSLMLVDARTVTLPVLVYNAIRSIITPDLAAVSVVYVALAGVAIWLLDRLVGLEIFLKSKQS